MPKMGIVVSQIRDTPYIPDIARQALSNLFGVSHVNTRQQTVNQDTPLLFQWVRS